MLYVREPEDEEYQELRRMTRQEVGRVSQRAHMVLLSAQGRSVPEMATIFAITPASVRSWLRRFDRYGPAGLSDAPRSGRPRLVDGPGEDVLVRLITADPATVTPGSEASFWTVAMLTLALIVRLGRYISASTVRNALHRMKYSWHRPRLGMPDKVDPQKAQKQWAIAEAVIRAGAEAAVLYADESRVQTLPILRAMWQKVGMQVRIPTPGSNVSRAIFGALEIRTGQWTYLVREHMCAVDFIAFLEHVQNVYVKRPIILVIDNYSSHTAGSVAVWLRAHPHIQVFPLPKYCSHLNPVEKIWLRMKNRVAANRLYGSMTAVLQAVDTFFGAMDPEQALRWAAEEKW
ncbi:MAG: IS630 family transposase [Chloroflexales bacterium]